MLTTKEYLRDLAERLRKVPVMYGTDDGDIDRLLELAKTVQYTEQDVVLELVREFIAQGYKITVDDGDDDFLIKNSDVYENVAKELFSMDQDVLYVNKPNETGATILLVYGNAPDEVVCDHTSREDINQIIDRVRVRCQT